MNRQRLVFALILVTGLVILSVAGVAVSQTLGDYVVPWHVVGSGGGPADSASYVVNGTVGQAAAGPPELHSSRHTVSAGYWFSGSLARPHHFYVPLIAR